MDVKILKKLLSEYQSGHTEFQCDYFIVGKSGNKYGQYKQALAELYKRFTALRDLTYEKEKVSIECEREDHNSHNLADQFDRRLASLEYKRKLMQLEEIDRNIKTTNREFLRFYQHAASLFKELSKDGPINKSELEKKHWIFNLKCKAAIDLASNGRVSNNVYEAIIACPHDVRIKILEEI